MFRADRLPVPSGEDHRRGVERLNAAIASGAEVDLEIGCGVGWHPIRYSRENPERFLVAIERTAEKAAKFRARLERNPDIPNLIPVHADAVSWVTHYVPDSVVSRIFFFYPNPSPKNPAARWIRMPFFGHLLKKLRPGGRIEFRTNLEDYAEEVSEWASSRWGLHPVREARFTGAEVPPETAKTHFEKKYLERGETCFLSEWSLSAPGTLR